MGIIGWIRRKAKAVTNGVGNVFKTAGRSINKGYKKFTGQATFEEADRLYDEVYERLMTHKAYFEKEVDTLCKDIDKSVSSINKSKVIIKTELFPAFADKIKILKDVPISKIFIKECYIGSTLKVDEMKSKADLYLIDFKKKPFKSNALAIISLGIYTRKKAKETLETVREEKARMEEEIQRMDSELVKLQKIKEALELIAEYYTSLIDIYIALLNRLDNSVNFLIAKCISFTHKLVKEQMSIKLLPKSQQKEIMAMWSISQVLKTMVETKVTLEGTSSTINSNLSTVRLELGMYKEKINNFYSAA